MILEIKLMDHQSVSHFVFHPTHAKKIHIDVKQDRIIPETPHKMRGLKILPLPTALAPTGTGH